jgi:hypothetical protein
MGAIICEVRMRIKLPVRRVVDLQRLLMTLGDVNAMVNPVARGNTFRRRLDKATDDELDRFLRGVKRLAHVLDPFQRALVDLELEIASDPYD